MSDNKWSKDKAWSYYNSQPWLSGCNFIPSSAINQLEMWQEATFDLEIIRKELTFAADLGFNCMRVYLHDLLWKEKKSFINQINQFLDLCKELDILVILVLLDDCWHENPKLGIQNPPTPYRHNSGWLKSPGSLVSLYPKKWTPVKEYVQGILTEFSGHSQIILWDLYNEPGATHANEMVLPLVEKVFEWAREVNPSQPLTCSFWEDMDKMLNLKKIVLEMSDIITFHQYGTAGDIEKRITSFEEYERPIICTEYMARHCECTFESHLELLQKRNIGAINWGLVAGKTNTHFPWDFMNLATDLVPGTDEPKLWFHDILRPDGSAFDDAEIEIIQTVNAQRKTLIESQ